MVEVKLRVGSGTDLSWIRQSLDAAVRRVDGAGPGLKILSVVLIPEERRLSCLVSAVGREDVQRLFEIALLPSARVLEAIAV